MSRDRGQSCEKGELLSGGLEGASALTVELTLLAGLRKRRDKRAAGMLSLRLLRRRLSGGLFGERRKSARTSRRSPKQTPHQPAPLALLPHTATHTAIGCTLSQAEKGREGGGDPLPLSRLQQQQAARLLLCLRRRLSCRFNRRLQTETIGEPRHSSQTTSNTMSTPRRIIAAAQQSLLRLLQLPLSLLRLSSSPLRRLS